MHVLVNNAGGALGLEPVAQADVELWQQMYETNVLGTLRVTKALLPALVAADGEGVVVNVGSIAGFLAYEGGGGYTVAKHGVHVMTETLRLELVDQPVRITLVAPGMVRTEEFSLTRFGGDRERADAVYAGVPEPARRRGRRRRHRLDGDPPGPRQHRPARRQAARAGRPAQGPPRAVARPRHPAPSTPRTSWRAGRVRAGGGGPPRTPASPRSPSPTRVNTSRSCSRLRRPAQNSTSSGDDPEAAPEVGHRHVVVAAVVGEGRGPRGVRASSSAREPIGSDCCEAHAEIREAHGRESKYCSTSSRGTSTAVPRNRIARYIAGQVRDAATAGFTASSRPLVEVSAVTNPGPRSSRKRMSTVRTFGRPSASTVATEIASGSNTSRVDLRAGHGVVDPGPRLGVGGVEQLVLG